MKKFTKLPLLKLCSMIASIMLFYSQLNAQSCPKAVTWEQNFNSEQELNDNWFFYEGSNYPNNQEIAWFQRQNASIVKEGNSSYLKITAKYEPGLKAGRENLEFSSSRMHSRMPVTNDLKTAKYGKVSARIKTSTNGDRAWPAFWMLPKNVNWPKDGEIDMMEQRVRKGKHVGLNGTTAFFQCPEGPCYLSKDTKSPEGANSFWNAFHVYGVEWSPNQLKYLLDGVVVYTINASDKPGLWPYNDKEFYVILNLAVGSQNTLYFKYNEVKDVNNPTPEEKIEQDRPTDPSYFIGKDVSMLVDWVKVEQGADDNEIVGDQQVYSGEVKDYYVARPGVDNAYSWSVPRGGTLISGQGTSAIKVKWIGGMTEPLRVNYANGNCRVALSRQVLPKGNPFPTVLGIENFEGVKPGFVPRSTGTRTFVAANGGTVLSHTSPGGKVPYDFLGIRTNKIGNAYDFSMGYKKIVLDVWTNAPVGTKIAAQLENSITSQGSNFPVGVHSGYGAYTTVKGRWETLELNAEALRNGTSPTSIDNIVILFDPGTASKYSYLIDNIRVRGTNLPPMVKAGDMLEDYEVNFADKIKIENAISPGYNAGPRPNDYGVNATNGAKFVRPNGLYSGFFFASQVSFCL
jgi:beta-glucanase (GH16 family)